LYWKNNYGENLVLLLCGVYVNLTVQSERERERERGKPPKTLTDLTSPRNFWMHATSSQHSINKAVFKIKIVLFCQKTTTAHNYQHPSLVRRFGIF
jgi:hypothetical protein